MNNQPLAIFWFRRDLRLQDNVALHHALQSGLEVLPIFIFDDKILSQLPKNDARVNFIHKCLENIQKELAEFQSSIWIEKGEVLAVWQKLLAQFSIKKVFFNRDYEPNAIARDKKVIHFLEENKVEVETFKDQVIFETTDILKADQTPYTVFTPYKKKWLEAFQKIQLENYDLPKNPAFLAVNFPPKSLEKIGFETSSQIVKPFRLDSLDNYDQVRDYPAQDATSYLSPHLRFGTVSVRQMVQTALNANATFLSELIWREFFMQILFHFPHSTKQCFKSKYENIPWKNDLNDFQRWMDGNTGYPLVDAGMRQLNQTGYMHNRVRMVVASFLCKHLLIDWRWGEAYFAQKLLDYDQSANVGNWQWAAGCGCDAAPYFRVFNPSIQQQKFDPKGEYIQKWIENFAFYNIEPIVNHAVASKKAIETYKKALEG